MHQVCAQTTNLSKTKSHQNVYGEALAIILDKILKDIVARVGERFGNQGHDKIYVWPGSQRRLILNGKSLVTQAKSLIILVQTEALVKYSVDYSIHYGSSVLVWEMQEWRTLAE